MMKNNTKNDDNIISALNNLHNSMNKDEKSTIISFKDFLYLLEENPERIIRSVFQVFHDMIKSYVKEGIQEYPNDPEAINFVDYDCKPLFVEGTDNPFFADRLFANRLINNVTSLIRGAQQNKIYIFEGPHGSGKSTFLNNLLLKFEEYANTIEGRRYEVVWRLNQKLLGGFVATSHLFEKFQQISRHEALNKNEKSLNEIFNSSVDEYLEIPCPSHDHPILLIPKEYRRALFDDILENNEFKWKLFTMKEYEWVFRDNPCTICTSISQTLLSRFKDPLKMFEMLFVKPYVFNRRVGEGISVFNPGDRPVQITVEKNIKQEQKINDILKASSPVKYIFSRFARTNNGIYALMDVKAHNKNRFLELHNIISEGLHKVQEIEENVNSLFFALMNPEDKSVIDEFKSFTDRIELVTIAYILDLNTEVEIYRSIFGKHIDRRFLPRVLNNFARVIISSRLNIRSDALLEWISNSKKYSRYCDENLQLLKMELYTGHIPPWLTEEDQKALNAKRRHKILAEAEKEGLKGFSGRDSIKIFSDFYSTYSNNDKLISMANLLNYFTKVRKDLLSKIPRGFLDSLVRLYNYTVLQEVKESLYYYNEDQINKDIKNYLFAINFEIGEVEICSFTNEKISVTEDFFTGIEHRILGTQIEESRLKTFRKETQKEYTSKTLPQEIGVDGKSVDQTTLFQSLKERYIHNLKENVLDPFLENENFRRAIKNFDNETFKTYDYRIRNDVTFLLNNLEKKHGYALKGAQEVCIYVIDNKLTEEFS